MVVCGNRAANTYINFDSLALAIVASNRAIALATGASDRTYAEPLGSWFLGLFLLLLLLFGPRRHYTVHPRLGDGRPEVFAELFRDQEEGGRGFTARAVI
jgi:hypothetical protein